MNPVSAITVPSPWVPEDLTELLPLSENRSGSGGNTRGVKDPPPSTCTEMGGGVAAVGYGTVDALAAVAAQAPQALGATAIGDRIVATAEADFEAMLGKHRSD